MRNELIGIRIDTGEKFTKQIKISMPKNYIRAIDQIAESTNVPKRIIVWEALGAYFQACRQSGATSDSGDAR
jgi:predicted transcriptional regulator